MIDLPDVLQGSLDAATLEALLRDVEATGGPLAVVVKAGRRADAPRGATTLDDAREALRAGLAVQLRYVHDGREWWDTLLPAGPGAWRLVRVAHAA